MLTVQTAPPDQRLQPFVRSYVHRQTDTLQQEIIEPVVGRLGTMLEFQFGLPFQVPLYDSDLRPPAPRICFIGPMTGRAHKLIIGARVETFTVLFRPQGFRACFDLPMSHLTDIGIEGPDLAGSAVSRLFERLGNATTFAARIVLVDHYLLDRLSASEPLNGINRALARLTRPGCSLSVGALAVLAGVSTRQLERKSQEFTGVSPKQLVRIARFQAALRMRSRGKGSWSEIAHHLGYFDQMHLVRDFKALAGDSPTNVLQQVAPGHLISL